MSSDTWDASCRYVGAAALCFVNPPKTRLLIDKMHHVTAQIAQFFQLRRALAKWITATEDAVMLEVQNIHATRIQAVYRGHLDRMDVLAMRRAIAAEEARKLKVPANCLPFPAPLSQPACLLPLVVDLLHLACQSSPHRFDKSGSGRQSATNDAKRAPRLRGEQASPLMGSTFSSTLRYTSNRALLARQLANMLASPHLCNPPPPPAHRNCTSGGRNERLQLLRLWTYFIAPGC